MTNYENKFIIVILIILTLLIVFGLYSVIRDSNSPTFELRKDEFECTKSHSEHRTRFLMVGKVMIPQSYTVEVCDEYKRIKK